MRTETTLRQPIRYIELKTGYADNGPAWIGFVQLSKSGRTVYFNGKAFQRSRGTSGNHRDLESGEEYWISGTKKDGRDRHWAGSGTITIEASAVTEYLRLTGQLQLDSRRFTVSDSIKPTDPRRFVEIENRRL